MRAVDTNVLVRLLTRDDAAQTHAAERYISHGAWVSVLVLTETVWTLESVYERSGVNLAAAIEMLLRHDRLVVQEADLVEEALARFRAKPSVDFSDHLILETARKAGNLPLGTFDRRLSKLDGAERAGATS